MAKLEPISLANISRFRAELMGIAIVLIVLFHVPLSRWSPFFGLYRMGNVGVDVFFFLSGVGLWFSWVKTPSAAHFYRRRLLRIMPAWLVMSSLFYVPDFFCTQKYSSSILDVVLDVTVNWDFWRRDELTFWYIPATMMLYLFAPAYMSLVRKHPDYRWLTVAMIAWCFIVQYVRPVHAAVGHLEIFWSRVPIFFIGINFGEWVRQKRELEGTSVWLLLLLFAMTLSSCVYMEQVFHYRFPIFLERLMYIPMTVSGLILLTICLGRLGRGSLAALSFVGSLSLEIYLIHQHFVLPRLELLRLGYWATALLCLAVSVLLAWLLHKAISMAIEAVGKKRG